MWARGRSPDTSAIEMSADAVQITRRRGPHLLLAHWAVLGETPEEGRLPAHDRLADSLGGELAERLVRALGSSHARRPRELGA